MIWCTGPPNKTEPIKAFNIFIIIIICTKLLIAFNLLSLHNFRSGFNEQHLLAAEQETLQITRAKRNSVVLSLYQLNLN